MSSKHDIYAGLSAEQRVQFWSIFSTAVVGLFSFWLGIAIQDDISSKNARETQKLARYQMVEAVYPKYTQFIDTGGYVFYDLVGFASLDEQRSRAALKEYLEEELMPLVETMKNSVNFMSDNRYYFGNDVQCRICQNNIAILFGLRMLEPRNTLLQDLSGNATNAGAIVTAELRNPFYIKELISYRDDVTTSLKERTSDFLKMGDTSAASVAYNFMFLPYIDNFNIYSQELTPNDDVGSHLWKHIFMLVGCIILELLISFVLLKKVFNKSLTNK